MILALVLVGAMLAVLAWLNQPRTKILQYLYFCRFPLLFGGVSLALPLLAFLNRLSFLPNFYVVTPWGMLWLTFAAAAFGRTIQFILGLLLVALPYRVGLPFHASDADDGLPHAAAPSADTPPSDTPSADTPRAAAPRADTPSASEAPAAAAPVEPGPLQWVVNKLDAVAVGIYRWMTREDEKHSLWRSAFFLPLFTLPHLLMAFQASRAEHGAGGLLLGAASGVVLVLGMTRLVLAGSIPASGLLGRVWNLSIGRWITRLAGFLGDRVELELRSGFVEQPHVRQRHLLAMGSLFLSVLAYGASGYLFRPRADPAEVLQAPVLAVVLLLLFMLCWGLSGIAFVVDRYRVPVLAFVAAWVIVGYHLARVDHYFEVIPVAEQERAAVPTVRETYQTWSRLHPVEQYPYVVGVAANGGGIAASLWTAKVLTELASALEDQSFEEALWFISSVSGGSVGTMHYLAVRAQGNDAAGTKADRSEPSRAIVEAAGDPSLPAAAWGMAYPDLLRLAAPVVLRRLPLWDRGWAIERPWRDRLPNEESATLVRWAAKAANGTLPVVFFNTTVSETGEPMLLGTASWETTSNDALDDAPEGARENAPEGALDDAPEGALDDAPEGALDDPSDGARENAPEGALDEARDGARDGPGPRSFLDEYDRSVDVHVASAARMSATFPFVTPIARPLGDVPDDRAWHLADGGYFDNFGIATSLDAFQQVLGLIASDRADARTRGVILVQIRNLAPAEIRADGGGGLKFVTVGPLSTLLEVRSKGQQVRNDAELRYFAKACEVAGVPFRTVKFELRSKTPLSWQLSQCEKDTIVSTWSTGANPDQLDALRGYLSGSE